MKEKVYCKGCKYLKEGDGFIRCGHSNNLVTKNDAYAPFSFNPIIEKVNENNDCKLRMEVLKKV